MTMSTPAGPGALGALASPAASRLTREPGDQLALGDGYQPGGHFLMQTRGEIGKASSCAVAAALWNN